MVDLIVAAFKAVAAYCLAMFNAGLDVLLALVPTTWKAPTETFVQYCRIANAWVPIDVAMVLLVTYLGFRVAWTAFRIIFRVIRG